MDARSLPPASIRVRHEPKPGPCPTPDTQRPNPFRKYLLAFRLSVRQQLAYRGELWVRTLFLVLILFVFSSLWRTTYGEMGRATLGGLTFVQMLWYLAITESIVTSRPIVSLRIDEEVRTGAIAYTLARPYRFLVFRYAQAMGEWWTRLLFNLAVALPIAFLFTRGIGLSTAGLLPGLAVLAGAMLLDYLLTASVHLLGFWAEDTTGFQLIYSRCVMIAGGMLLPLSLFPGPVEAVLRLLPFGAIAYGPAQTLVAFEVTDFARIVAVQAAWIALAVLLAAVLFRLGERQVAANGG